MIKYLFSMLLVPLLPELMDPSEKHLVQLTELERRLNVVQKNESEAAANTELKLLEGGLSADPVDLPVISGRLFEWSSSKLSDEADRVAEIDKMAESLRLTGMIESAGSRAAILNDGQRDLVVGVGSYVLDAYRVSTLGNGQVVLLPIDQKSGGKRLELNLMPVDMSGGL